MQKSKDKAIRPKTSRALHCRYCVVDAELGTRDVRLIFCRQGKNDKWRLLVSTDMKLDFKTAYRIYAMRWAVEVFYADTKRVLGLTKCSARDFGSHIAHMTMVAIRYSMMSYVKRFYDYETIGGLFHDTYLGVLEFTVVDCIWEVIIEVINVISDILTLNQDELLNEIITNSRRMEAFKLLAKTV